MNELVSMLKNRVRTLQNLLYQRTYLAAMPKDDVVGRFHKLYYDSNVFGKTWGDTTFLGVKTLKCPLDLWLYQEIIHETRPDLIVETGTRFGGSSLFLASHCEMIGHGRVLSIDIEDVPDRPAHPRLTYWRGSSTSPEALEQIRERNNILVILDSDHKKEHVLTELKMYSPFIPKGGYIIAEDTNLNGHPVDPGHGPGPWEAVEEFLAENPKFSRDPRGDKFYLTFNPGGILRRKN